MVRETAIGISFTACMPQPAVRSPRPAARGLRTADCGLRTGDSEIELHPELDDPRRGGRQDLAEAARVARDVGRTEVRMVERVEDLRPELEVAAIGHLETL